MMSNHSTHSTASLSSSHTSLSSMPSSFETPEARQLRREFRLQQVEMMEMTALGLGKAKGVMTLDISCLKKMEEQNLEISNHSHRGSSRGLPRRVASMPASSFSGRPSFSRMLGGGVRRRESSSLRPQQSLKSDRPLSNGAA